MPHPRLVRLGALGTLIGLLVVATGVAVTAAPAGAAVTTNEIALVPATGSLAIEGHGWGHGHGMSQWGAQGGATLGRTADQIVGFYYPGTTKTTISNSSLRVLISADTGGDTQVYAATGLTVTDLASGVKATLPAAPTRWRSVTDSAGLHLQSYSGSWSTYALGGKTVFTGPLQFGGPAVVRLALPDGTSRDYRGVMRSVRTSATAVQSINVLAMESYLGGVVPRESSSSWQPAALQSQAIAARTYAAENRGRYATTRSYDICDSTQCQVYGGAAVYTAGGTRTALEAATTQDAIAKTAGVIRTYQGAPIFAQFSASSGGWTTDGGQPYLPAQRDDWDGAVPNTVHSWSATLSAAQLQAHFPSIGTVKRIVVTSRDGNGEWGGRVQTVTLEGVSSSGAATSVATTGAGIYGAHSWPASSDGLRSSWWHVKPAYNSAIVSQSGAPTLVQSPGVSTGSLTVSMRNTGTVSWSTTGLHLAVASPPGQADPLVGGSTRPGTYTGSATSIAPGDVAAFHFALTGDGVTPGLQGRSYRLRIGSGAVFGVTVSWRIPVQAAVLTAANVGPPVSLDPKPASAPADQPGVVFADGRTVVLPNDGSTPLRLTVRNTGNVSWPLNGQVRLGVFGTWPSDTTSPSSGASWVTTARPSVLSAGAAVAPAGTGTFDLTLYGNHRSLGLNRESFEPVWDGQRWFSGAGTQLDVIRVDPSVSRQATLDSLSPAKVVLDNGPHALISVRIRLRNVGGSPWAVGKERLQAVATALSTSAWASPTVPPALSVNVSRPGQANVYPGEVGEWQVPLSALNKPYGSYGLSFRAQGPSGGYGPQVAVSVTVANAVLTAQLVKVAPAVTVPQYGHATTYFDIKNTGNVAWPVGGRLRSYIFGSSSPSYYSSWINVARPSALGLNLSSPGSTGVLPGQVGRFWIVLAGNGRAKQSASESFGVVWEGWKTIAGLKVAVPYRIG